MSLSNNIKRLGEILKQFDENPPPVYFYMGHGADLCDKDGKMIEKQVPEGCLYITMTKCGFKRQNVEKELSFFAETNNIARELIQRPYAPDNVAKLANYLGIDKDDINIKYPGDTYVVSDFSPFVYWYKKFRDQDNGQVYARIISSGLLEKKKLEEFYPMFVEFNTLTHTPVLPLENTDPTKTIPLSSRELHIFFDSIAYENFSFQTKIFKPKKKILMDLFQSKNTPITLDRVSDFLSKVMKEMYKEPMPTCEVFPKVQGAVNQYLKQYLAGKNALTYDEINRLYLVHVFRIYKEEFLNLFSASVFPTKEQVSAIWDKAGVAPYMNMDDLHKMKFIMDTELGRNEDPEKSKTTNAFLMETFPGIHYNIVCRDVEEQCKPAAVLRRSISVQQFTQRQQNILAASAASQEGGGKKRKTRRSKKKTASK